MNYYSSVFVTQSCLRLWRGAPRSPYARHIVFTSSTAAFVGLPGYIAYTPTKVAVRALADTLRQELLLYGDEDAYKVHCSFPGTFLTDAILEEQTHKPELLKILEKTNVPEDVLKKTSETSMNVARKIIRGLEAGKTFITVDFEGDMLLNNMRGPSPRKNSIYDFLVGCIGAVVWWVVRLDFDRKTRQYGRTQKLRDS
jgi:3-dehydrosphinganine reductase